MDIKNPLIPREKLRFLGTIDIIKSTIRIPFRNPSFIVLTFLTSLPLFCTLLVEKLLVRANPSTLEETSSLLSQDPPVYDARKLIQETSRALLQEDFVYMIFFDLLHLILVVTTVYSASVIHTGGRRLGLRDMLHDSVIKTRWKWPLVTYIYMALLFKISYYAISYWSAIGFFFIHVNTLSSLISIVIITSVVLWKQVECLASWNMGVVISILEEKSVFEAMSRSTRLGKGNRLRGAVLMLFHFVLCFGLDLLLRKVRGSFSVIAYDLLHTSLGVGEVMKWSVCMVYYHDCKMRHEKKAELEEES